MLTTGRAAMTFAHANQIVAWQGLNKSKLGMTMFPQGKQAGQYYKPSMLLSMSATTQQPREAASYTLDPERPLMHPEPLEVLSEV